MFMKDFFNDLFTLLFFVVALSLFYAAITVAYNTIFFNLILIVFSIFVLLQGCERVDRANGLGKYAEDEKESEEQDSDNNQSHHFPHYHKEM